MRHPRNEDVLASGRMLRELALESTAVHRERTGGLRHVASVLLQYPIDVLPLEAVDGHGFRTRRHFLVAGFSLEGIDEVVGVRGFGQVVRGAELDRLDRRGNAAVAGQNHDASMRVETDQGRHKLETGPIGQPQVHHGVLRRVFVSRPCCLLSGKSDPYIESTLLEGPGERVAQHAVVVDQQQARRVAAAAALLQLS